MSKVDFSGKFISMGRLFEILNRKWNQAYYKEFNLRIKQSRKKNENRRI